MPLRLAPSSAMGAMLFRLVDVLTDQEELCPPAVLELPRSVVYTNEAQFDPRWVAHMLTEA